MLAACGPGEDAEPTGQTSDELTATDPVSLAVSQSCSTTSVKGLAEQIIEEVQCMKPGTMSRIDTIKNVSLGSAVFPYLQTPAKNALAAAVAARGTTMTINSALRTLPQQYLLYAWYKTGRCGIGLAASPGNSNHESGLALDIEDHAGWNNAMSSHDFKWFGNADPVHFDYVGGGTTNLFGLDVEAFQRLWNRNHPNDLIAVDGSYGPETESRLVKSPIGGFPIGAQCNNSADAGSAEPPPPPPPPDPPPRKDFGGAPNGSMTGAPDGAEPASGQEPRGDHAGGCSTSGATGSDWLLALVAIAPLRRAIRRARNAGGEDRIS
jgi:hypothetical protein